MLNGRIGLGRYGWAALLGTLSALALSALSCGSSTACTTGKEKCGCKSDGTCKSGLSCFSGLCVNAKGTAGGSVGSGGDDSGTGGDDTGSGGDTGEAGASTPGQGGAGGGGGSSGSGGDSSGSGGGSNDAGRGGSSGGGLDGGRAGGSVDGGQTGANLVTNGDFSNGETGWNLTLTGSPSHSVNGSGQLCATVSSSQGITIGWPATGASAASLSAGTNYVLRYDAFSTPAGYPMKVKVGLSVDPYTSDFDTTDTLGGSSQTITHPFTTTASDTAAGIAFFVSQPSVDTTVCIDNVVLARQ